MRKATIFVMLWLLFSMTAKAQVGPTDNELKAGYCFGVTKVTYQSFEQYWNTLVASHQDSTPGNQALRKGIVELADKMNRLRSYVGPKVLEDPSMQIAIAIKRGEADVTEGQSERVMQCTQRCALPTKDTAKQMSLYKACVATCSPTFARTWSCNDTSWLPY